MQLGRLFIAALLAAILFALFLLAVREGLFASPAWRIVMVAAIAILALLVWLGPTLAA